MVEPVSAEQVVRFWREAGPSMWFQKDVAFDAAIRARFEDAHHAAARNEYSGWEKTPEGALALVILLDQFPRNLYRGSGHAFATDGLALAIAKSAVSDGFDRQTDGVLRIFYYMPFEHSESLDDQRAAVRLFEAYGDEEYLRYARLHADIIERFGRFPHRNIMLGRQSHTEEIAFLADGGFAG